MSFEEQHPQKDFVVEAVFLGPIVQKENIGVSIMAGYCQINLAVFLNPQVLIKTAIA